MSDFYLYHKNCNLGYAIKRKKNRRTLVIKCNCNWYGNPMTYIYSKERLTNLYNKGRLTNLMYLEGLKLLKDMKEPKEKVTK